MPPLYLLHPIAVHFAVALLVAGFCFKALGEWKPQGPAKTVSLWILRVASPAAILTAALGLLASHSAPHVPAAWETMHDHKVLGLCTAGTSVILWIIEELRRRQHRPWQIWGARLLWLAVVGLIIATGDAGGDLVYQFGVGVATASHL